MVDWVVTHYASAVLAEAAIEAVANTVRVLVIPYMESGKQKFMLCVGGNY